MLVVVGFFWLAEQSSGVSFVEDAQRRGFVAMMRAVNAESQPVTFVVEELRTNATSGTASVGRETRHDMINRSQRRRAAVHVPWPGVAELCSLGFL